MSSIPKPQFIGATLNALFLMIMGILFFIDIAGTKSHHVCNRILVLGGIQFGQAIVLICYVIFAACLCGTVGYGAKDPYSRPVVYLALISTIGLSCFGLSFWVLAGWDDCHGRMFIWPELVFITMATGICIPFGCFFMFLKRKQLYCLRTGLLRYWTTILPLAPFSLLFFSLLCCKSKDETNTIDDNEHVGVNIDRKKGSSDVELPETATKYDRDSFQKSDKDQPKPIAYGNFGRNDNFGKGNQSNNDKNSSAVHETTDLTAKTKKHNPYEGASDEHFGDAAYSAIGMSYKTATEPSAYQ